MEITKNTKQTGNQQNIYILKERTKCLRATFAVKCCLSYYSIIRFYSHFIVFDFVSIIFFADCFPKFSYFQLKLI